MDPDVGEFQYEIFGEVSLPDIYQEVRIQSNYFVDEKVIYDLIISFKND